MDVITAHKFSIRNRRALEQDNICGCFNCLRIFKTTEIRRWLEDKGGDTAMCPYCGIDSIISESSGFPITPEFMKEMQKHWFGEL